VGEEDGGSLLPVLGFILTNPEDLRRRVTGKHGVAGEFHDLGLSSEGVGQLGAFSGGGGIAPEFGRADDLILGIEKNQSVLLAADTDSGNFRATGSELLENLSVSPQSVPEPSIYALFGIGAIGMLMVLRRKKAA